MKNLSWFAVLMIGISVHAAEIKTAGPGIFRGPKPSNMQDLQTLKAMGVRTIVDLQGDPFLAMVGIRGESSQDVREEVAAAARLKMNVIALPFIAAFGSNDRIESALIETARNLDNPAMQPVYIHCSLGADRTGVMIAIYRIVAQNCSAEAARHEMFAEGSPLTPVATLRFEHLLWKLEQYQRMAPVPGKTCPLFN
jgi:protein tyrosine/serine phosphatase